MVYRCEMTGNVLDFKRKNPAADKVARQIRACAWRGFLAMGRGAVVIDPDPILPGYEARYFARDSDGTHATVADCEDPQGGLALINSMVDEYNPESQVVIVTSSFSGDMGVAMRTVNPAPPEA
jgi:hypothetical protein